MSGWKGVVAAVAMSRREVCPGITQLWFCTEIDEKHWATLV